MYGNKSCPMDFSSIKIHTSSTFEVVCILLVSINFNVFQMVPPWFHASIKKQIHFTALELPEAINTSSSPKNKVVYIIQCVILGFYKTVANYDFSLCQTLMYKFKKFPTNNQSSNNQFIYTGAIQIFHGLVCESNHKC